jgi:hypothetical protein
MWLERTFGRATCAERRAEQAKITTDKNGMRIMASRQEIFSKEKAIRAARQVPYLM